MIDGEIRFNADRRTGSITHYRKRNMTLRVIFAGTPDFAVPSLKKIVDTGVQVAAVLTQPDRTKGRGRKLAEPPVKSFAQQHQLPVIQTEQLSSDVVEEVRLLNADMMVVVAFGLILPRALIELPRYGCVNVHASLLPRWRGAAPVARAIEAGDTETGVTIMQMDEGLDTGEILSQAQCLIEPNDTAATLHDKLSELGASELIRLLPEICSHSVQPLPQNETDATYAAKLNTAEAAIDWRLPAVEIVRKIRAYNPWPVARTRIGSLRLRIWEAQVFEKKSVSGKPGEVLDAGKFRLDVMAGGGALRITSLQREGKNRMAASDFLAGHQILPGSVFASVNASQEYQ